MGTLTALITPFQGDEIDWNALLRIADVQARAGVNGLVLMGTTAEVFALNDEEQVRIFQTLRTRLGATFPLWWGCGTSSTRTTVERVRRAETLGADGAMIVTPPYVKPNAHGMRRHIAEICERTALPIMLYNNPGRAAISLEVSTLIDLCQFEQVTAIKESGSNLHRAMELIRLRPQRVSILAGDDAWIAPMLLLGAQGAVSVSANLLPKAVKSLIDKGRFAPAEVAAQLHHLWPLFRALDLETNPLVIKYLMSRKGWCSADVRAPLGPLEDATLQALDPLLSDAHLTAEMDIPGG